MRRRRRAQETCTGETGCRRHRAQEILGAQEMCALVELRLGCASLGFITEPHRQTNRKWEIQFTLSAESEGRELNEGQGISCSPPC